MAKIILVEDDKWMADCYAKWLQADGRQIYWAQDAQEAIDLVDQEQPDLIVLDLMLPFSNGIQLLQTLQSHADLMVIPVILCSSSLPANLPDMSSYGVHVAIDKSKLTPEVLRQLTDATVEHATV